MDDCIHGMNPEWCALCNGADAKFQKDVETDEFIENLLEQFKKE